MKKKTIQMLCFDCAGSLFLGSSIVCFAVAANFAPGGVNGLAVMANYLFHIPIGWATILINIPIILLTFRKLGRDFFLISVKSMLISSLFIDYVLCYLPVYTGSRLLASVFAGIMAGIGYSLFFNEGSSTGGTDFIIVAMKQRNPGLSFGALAFAIDGVVIILSVFVFREIWAFIYGMVYTVITSIALDGTTLFLKKANLSIYRDESEQKTEADTAGDSQS